MSRKVYNVIAASVTGVIGIVAAVIALVNPPMVAAIEASLPVLEGAVLTIANNFVVEDKVENKTEDK